MAPGEHHVIHTAARLVDGILCAVYWVSIVGIVDEGVQVDDALVEGAANGKGVADNVPLALGAVEEEELAEVMNESGQLHPSRFSIAADGFCGLQ
jgi:hypothetical protein